MRRNTKKHVIENPDVVVEQLKEIYNCFYDVRVMDTRERILVGIWNRMDNGVLVQELLEKKYYKFFPKKSFKNIGFETVVPEVTKLVHEMYEESRVIASLEDEEKELQERFSVLTIAYTDKIRYLKEGVKKDINAITDMMHNDVSVRNVKQKQTDLFKQLTEERSMLKAMCAEVEMV